MFTITTSTRCPFRPCGPRAVRRATGMVGSIIVGASP
jgi:hypothetical protein